MDFLGKKLLFITAHPDDESFLAAGTIKENKKRGGSAYIVCATYGERGRSHVKEHVTPAKLKSIRRQEFLKVSKHLGVKTCYGLNLPDGNLRAHIRDFYEKVLPLAKKLRPDAIVSFGPDGISGHRDHVVACTVSRKIARQLKLPFVAFALAPWFEKHFFTWLTQRKKHGVYVRRNAFGKANFKMKVDPKFKMKVLRMHASQTDKGNPFTGFPPRAVKEWLSAEYFVV